MHAHAGVRLPSEAVAQIVGEVASYGRGDGVETGGFLLAPSDDPDGVSVVAMAGETGIERAWGRFRVSALAIDVLFAWAEERGLRIPAQFHSHGIGRDLSLIDRREGFNVRGFISCVVPEFHDPPSGPNRWGWWLFDGASWVETAPCTVVDGGVMVVRFDEEGVRGQA
jgi:hypothetical protein